MSLGIALSQRDFLADTQVARCSEWTEPSWCCSEVIKGHHRAASNQPSLQLTLPLAVRLGGARFLTYDLRNGDALERLGLHTYHLLQSFAEAPSFASFLAVRRAVLFHEALSSHFASSSYVSGLGQVFTSIRRLLVYYGPLPRFVKKGWKNVVVNASDLEVHLVLIIWSAACSIYDRLERVSGVADVEPLLAVLNLPPSSHLRALIILGMLNIAEKTGSSFPCTCILQLCQVVFSSTNSFVLLYRSLFALERQELQVTTRSSWTFIIEREDLPEPTVFLKFLIDYASLRFHNGVLDASDSEAMTFLGLVLEIVEKLLETSLESTSRLLLMIISSQPSTTIERFRKVTKSLTQKIVQELETSKVQQMTPIDSASWWKEIESDIKDDLRESGLYIRLLAHLMSNDAIWNATRGVFLSRFSGKKLATLDENNLVKVSSLLLALVSQVKDATSLSSSLCGWLCDALDVLKDKIKENQEKFRIFFITFKTLKLILLSRKCPSTIDIQKCRISLLNSLTASVNEDLIINEFQEMVLAGDTFEGVNINRLMEAPSLVDPLFEALSAPQIKIRLPKAILDRAIGELSRGSHTAVKLLSSQLYLMLVNEGRIQQNLLEKILDSLSILPAELSLQFLHHFLGDNLPGKFDLNVLVPHWIRALLVLKPSPERARVTSIITSQLVSSVDTDSPWLGQLSSDEEEQFRHFLEVFAEERSSFQRNYKTWMPQWLFRISDGASPSQSVRVFSLILSFFGRMALDIGCKESSPNQTLYKILLETLHNCLKKSEIPKDVQLDASIQYVRFLCSLPIMEKFFQTQTTGLIAFSRRLLRAHLSLPYASDVVRALARSSVSSSLQAVLESDPNLNSLLQILA